MVKIEVINKGRQPLPAYATAQSAGMDLRANIPESITLQPLERRLIPTGLYIALPEGYEAQVRPRSGLALKHGITVLNSPGTIDSDYRGELMVLLINLSQDPFHRQRRRAHRATRHRTPRAGGADRSRSARRDRARSWRLWPYGGGVITVSE